MTEDKPESRLARWSRRKQQGAEATLQEDLALQLAEHDRVEDDFPEAEIEQDAQEVEVQEPVLTDADMPAIESLTEDSNFSQSVMSLYGMIPGMPGMPPPVPIAMEAL